MPALPIGGISLFFLGLFRQRGNRAELQELPRALSPGGRHCRSQPAGRQSLRTGREFPAVLFGFAAILRNARDEAHRSDDRRSILLFSPQVRPEVCSSDSSDSTNGAADGSEPPTLSSSKQQLTSLDFPVEKDRCRREKAGPCCHRMRGTDRVVRILPRALQPVAREKGNSGSAEERSPSADTLVENQAHLLAMNNCSRIARDTE